METLKHWLGVKEQEGGLQIQESGSVKTHSDTKSSAFKQTPGSETGKGTSPLLSLRDNAPKTILPVPASVQDAAAKPTVTQAPPCEVDIKTSVPNHDPPLKHCLSCKVIGTTTVTGAMVYVMYLVRRHRHEYTGWKKVAFMGQGFFLTTSLGLLAVSVLLDVGLLRGRKQGETILDHVKDDYNNLMSRLSNLSSSSGPVK